MSFGETIKNTVQDQIGSAVGMAVGQRLAGTIADFRDGRVPHPFRLIIVPKSPDIPGAERQIIEPPYQLNDLGIFAAISALIWYASREIDKARLGQIQQDMFAPKTELLDDKKQLKFIERDPKADQPMLFEAKRELSLELQDPAKSDDPITACMERKGYTEKQMDKMSDSIAEKATIDIFSDEQKELTGAEAQFQDDLQECIDKIKENFGSLEAAGYENIECDACNDDK